MHSIAWPSALQMDTAYWVLFLVLLGGDLWEHHDLTASFPSSNGVPFTPVWGQTILYRQIANVPVVGLHRPGLRGSAFLLYQWRDSVESFGDCSCLLLLKAELG